MLRRIALAGAFLSSFVPIACEEGTGPQGTAGTVVVRAYVDSDGSGAFSTDDVPIAGASVTLTPSRGGEAVSATTNATGIATFEGVMPGSYTAALTGTTPQGSVLASATNPVVVVAFGGGEAAADFRYVFNPGAIAGVLFRDNNSNGVFDPATDTPAAGLEVALFRGASTTGDPLATTRTSATGAFSFTTLRPGEYTVVLTPFPTIQIVGGVSHAVTVQPTATQALPVRFTGNLVSPIAQVRNSVPDATVAVEGVATVSPGIFSTSATGNQFNVQDATGGVLILDTPLSLGIQQGDSVRVIGRAVVSAGEFVIRNPVGGLLSITKLGTGTVPAPRVVTAAQVAASNESDPLQGLLVSVGNVHVTAVSGTATSTSYNVTVTDEAGGNSFIVRVGTAAVGIAQSFWQVGRSYDVTGLLGNFNGAQVKLRSAADVQARSVATPLGTLRAMAFADSIGTRLDTVTVEGVVHTAQGTFRTDNAFIQDATGGILLFNVPTAAALAVGDSIRVTAAIDWFNGELELVRFSSTSPPQIEKLGAGATPLARTISGAQFNSRAFEGQLVRVANVEVLTIGAATSSGAYTVTARAADGATIEIRIENSSIGIPTTSWVAGNRYTVVGALSHFRGIVQIKPRTAADVTAGSAAVMTIAAAELRPVNDTVTVEGVVTAPVGPFGTANAYIEDGTGGVQIFGVPTTVTLAIGDVIRVRGITGVFSGETQIARFSATELLQIEKLGTAAMPTPRLVTGAQVAARTFEGELVELRSVVVTAVGAVSASGGYNVTTRAADGTEVTVRNDRAAVGIPVAFWVVGSTYDVAGILSAFNGTPQLKARSPADVVKR